MKLKNHFFRVNHFCETTSGFDYIIEFNPDHIIYQAHFPNNPITPGVCYIQIIKELLSEKLHPKLFLKKISNIKYLNIINPLENKVVTFSITVSPAEKGTYKINTLVYHNDKQFAKLSLRFIEE